MPSNRVPGGRDTVSASPEAEPAMPRSDASAALPLLGRLKLRQLALVVAIDTHRSLRKAAEAVAVTQPAATRLLHDLEAALGVPLFVRHAWGMEPTGYGDAF